MYVIGITGKAGAGKDTLAEMLARELVGVVHLIGFADPIRSIASAIGFNISREYKEVEQAIYLEDAGGYLFDAIEMAVPLMPPALRARLYGATLEFFGLPEDGSPATLCMTPRRFMQQLGTEIGQSVDTLIWVNYLKARCRNIEKMAPALRHFVVVSDLRFPHEVAAVSTVARIERPGLAAVESHVSEQHTLDADIIVYNEGGLRELAKDARNMAIIYKEMSE